MPEETSINESDFFREAALQIFSSLDMDTALKRCMKYLENYLPVSGLILGYHEPELEAYRIVSCIMPPHQKKPDNLLPLPGELSILLKEIDKKVPTVNIVNDPEKAGVLFRQAISRTWLGGPVSALHIALDFGTERIGHLSLYAEGKHRYKEYHARLLYLLKDLFAVAISTILQHQEILKLRDMLAQDNLILRRQLKDISRDTIIGADSGLKTVMDTITQVANFNSPVLLLGETGVGKEILANAIHYGSSRKNNPFIKVNCGAIPETLIDSELFGHEKGAFTGAMGKKLGYFEQAHTGTIFLDEIGELLPSVQVRLLRVLQQHEIQRVGGTQMIPVDVRLICATHRNLEEMVQSGRFRKDLWFRLNVIPVMIPPLRKRPQDIPALIRHFVEKKSNQLKIPKLPTPAPGTLEYFLSYNWPGNVRELENVVERSLIQGLLQGNDNVLSLEQTIIPSFACQDRKRGDVSGNVLDLDQLNRNHIQLTLDITGGKVGGPHGAAVILGINPGTLRARMKKLGIPYGRKKKV